MAVDSMEHAPPRERLLDGQPAVSSRWRASRRRSTRQSWERSVKLRVALTDAVAVYVAVLMAFLIRFGAGELMHLDERTMNAQFAVTALVLIGVWLGALWLSDSLDLKLMGAGSQEYARVSNVTMAVFGAAAIAAYLTRWPLGRAFLAIALPLGLLLLNLGRYVMRQLLKAERRAGRNVHRAIVVGCREAAAHLIAELRRTPQAGIAIVGACVPGSAAEQNIAPPVAGVPHVGDIYSVPDYVSANAIDTVVVTGSDEVTPKALQQLAWNLEPHGTDLVLAPGLTGVAGQRIRTRPVPGTPLLHITAPGYTAPQLRVKRAADIVGSALLIVIFAPLMAVTALAVKFTSRGPVLFKQTRLGVAGRPFQILKFRSMCEGAEARLVDVLGAEASVYYKPKADPRVTRVGAVIRRFSIDELPQLLNVFNGSMSLVGPRPLTPHGHEWNSSEVERRMLLKPGMTGLWQVSGRSNLSVEESIRLDLYYVENWALVDDIFILLKTFRAVVSREGAV